MVFVVLAWGFLGLRFGAEGARARARGEMHHHTTPAQTRLPCFGFADGAVE
jgi:hypothetical protein